MRIGAPHVGRYHRAGHSLQWSVSTYNGANTNTHGSPSQMRRNVSAVCCNSSSGMVSENVCGLHRRHLIKYLRIERPFGHAPSSGGSQEAQSRTSWSK